MRERLFGTTRKLPARSTIPKAGVYQVDVYEPDHKTPAARRLASDYRAHRYLAADTAAAGRLEGKAKLVDSPLGQAVSFSGGGDGFTVPRAVLPMDDTVNVGEGDFSVSAWIHPAEAGGDYEAVGIVSLGANDQQQGWFLEMSDPRGTLGSGPRADARKPMHPSRRREPLKPTPGTFRRRGAPRPE